MKKLLFFCLASVLLFSGCVSAGKYNAAFDESEARRVQLEKVTAQLEAEQKANEGLKKELEGLKAEKQRLEASGSSSSGEAASLKSRVEELTAEKERLAAEITSLKGEVDRLKMKTGEISTEKEKEISNVKSTYENLVKELKKEIEQGDIKITQAVDRLSVNMVEKILFDSGKAEIKKDGLLVIKRVGDILKGVKDKQIRVEGYTDNVQIGSRIREKYPTNWELSTARATNVVRYLKDKVGVDPKTLSAAGFADNKPVASNDTLEGRAQNRRIEIVLLPLDADRVLEELKK